jgi:hypothetical protein
MTDPTTLEQAIAELRTARAEIDRLAAVPNVVRPTGGDAPNAVFLSSDLRDPVFFQAHRRGILKAASEGRIVNDGPDWRVGGKRKEGAK